MNGYKRVNEYKDKTMEKRRFIHRDNYQLIIFLLAVVMIGSVIFYKTWPVYTDFTKEVERLEINPNFVYINDSNMSQITYKEILDGRSLASKSTGRYEMSCYYTYNDYNYIVDIVVNKRSHYARVEYELYKNIKYYVESGESSIEYITFIENYIGEHVYVVSCRFLTDGMDEYKDMKEACSIIAKDLSYQLIDQYIEK